MNEPKTESDRDALDVAGDKELSDEQLDKVVGGRQTPKTDFGDRMKAGLDTGPVRTG